MVSTTVRAFFEKQRPAGFKHVPKPMPMRNRNNAIVYYLYFASPNQTTNKIVQYIFNKHKDRKDRRD